jgi:hypothetical protein
LYQKPRFNLYHPWNKTEIAILPVFWEKLFFIFLKKVVDFKPWFFLYHLKQKKHRNCGVFFASGGIKKTKV